MGDLVNVIIDCKFGKYSTILHKMDGVIPTVITQRDIPNEGILNECSEDLPASLNTPENSKV